jgi:hypothetical protein
MVQGLVQIAIFCALIVAVVPVLGGYMAHVFRGERTFLDPGVGPLERGTYRLLRIDPTRGQDWKAYARGVLFFSLAGWLLLFVILRPQTLHPWNPSGFHSGTWDLSFNTEAGNMVDLDSNPTKLIEIVEVGKQLLITRGALTTFSIANDVAKYFAILPAIFAFTYAAAGQSRGPLDALNIMKLGTPSSAIISAIVFNAVIIPLLVPLALRGVRYRPVGATALLRRNMLIYGLGGLVAPFVGIKLIDLIVHNLLGA